MRNLQSEHPYTNFLHEASYRLEAPPSQVTCLAFHALSGVYSSNSKIIKIFLKEKKASYNRELAFYKLAMVHALPVPQLLEFGELAQEIPFIITEKSKGDMLRNVIPVINEDQRIVLFSETQALLRNVHSIPINLPCSPVDETKKSWAEALQNESFLGLNLLFEKKLLSKANFNDIKSFLKCCFSSDSLNLQPSVLLHGDFCEKNILVDLDGFGGMTLTLIDFGHSRIGDPIFDFLKASQMYNQQFGYDAPSLTISESNRLFFYDICDYLMHIKNVFAINDSGILPFFHGKSFQYPDCHEEYIYSRMLNYHAAIAALPVSWLL